MGARAILRGSQDGRLARQLGSLVGDEAVDRVRAATSGFYFPVPVAGGLPVLAYRGELFWRSMGTGKVMDGAAVLPSPRSLREKLRAARPPVMGGGFASLSDLIAEATAGGKQQTIPYAKVGSISVAGGVEVGWVQSGIPAAGAAPTAISSGGNVPTNATSGALGQADGGGSDTLHLISAFLTPQGNAMTWVLFDRVWNGATNTNSSSTQAITGAPPTRYTSATAAKGNFAFPYSRSTVAATAHNHTVCQYRDQNNNTAESFASVGGNSGNVAGRVDFSTAGQWYMPLNSGDLGVKELTQWQFSAAMATGQIDLAIGHPLALIPAPASGVGAVLDGINSAFNLVEILDGACLDMLGIRPATTATSTTGMFVLASG